MNDIQTIPLNQLKASPLNVRKTGGKKVEELAASIRATGLQQNLGVIPDGGKYAVVFGGRRLRALQSLAKESALPDALAAGVPCRVMSQEEAQEASLAENTIREAMHPLDQFSAFQALADEGRDVAEIAARFGVTETVVRQRMRLARVSPKLLQAYGAGDMTLEQLQAFAVSDDHARQESTWKIVRGSEWHRNPEQIRRTLAATEVGRSDPRVQVVGLAAYEAAGGTLRRDLFSDEVAILDVPLLDRLANAALEEAAELLRAEGWAWVEVGGERPRWNDPRVQGEDNDTDEAIAEADALEAKLGAEGWLSVADLVRLDILTSPRYTAEQKAASGARVVLGHGGFGLSVYSGLLREGDATRADAGGTSTSTTTTGHTYEAPAHRQPETPATPAKQPGDMSFAAVQRLQAAANAIVQLDVARAPFLAMALLVARLAADLYQGWDGPRRWVWIGREASGHTNGPHRAAAAESEAGRLLQGIEAAWRRQLPKQAKELPAWAMKQTPDVLQELLAFLVAREIEVVDASGGGRADQGVVAMAALTGTDLAAHWRPTQEWLATLPKPAVMELVRDAAGKKVAEPLAKLKRAELPAAALPLFPAGWLPKPLRAPDAPRKKAPAKGKAAAAGDVA